MSLQAKISDMSFGCFTMAHTNRLTHPNTHTHTHTQPTHTHGHGHSMTNLAERAELVKNRDLGRKFSDH